MKMSKFRAVANTERGTRDALMRATTVTVFICLLLSMSADGAAENLEIPHNTGCVCPGDVLTYTCTTIGAGNTIWRGTAFDCSSSSNDIILRHSQFAGTGTVGSCSTGSLRAQSLRVEDGNCFVSQLNATVMASFDGQSIGCFHNSVSGTRLINESVLNVVPAANPSPPQNLSLVSISAEQVLFSWTALPPPCSLVEYMYIISSDCGVCPGSTNTSTTTCTGFQLPTQSNNTVCTFTINSRLCDITGDVSAEVVLRVPNVPSVENIIPSYLNNTKELKRLLISLAKNETEAIMNDVSGAISAYNLSLSTSAAGPTRSISIDADSGSCDVNTCTYTVDVPQDICMSSSNFSTALSARNRIGQGFPSDVVNIGCTNEFVRLYYNTTTSNFICVFTNELDNNEKFCSIRLTQGGQELPNTIQGRSTNTNASVVSLNLAGIASGMYSFNVLARSGVTLVQVEGNFQIDSEASISPAIAAVAVVPVAIIGAVVTVVCLMVAYYCYRKQRYINIPPSAGDKRTTDNVDIRHTKLERVPEHKAKNFRLFSVHRSCSQREAMSAMKLTGDTYYELTDEKEDIPNHKELMFILEEKFPKIQTATVHYSATNPNAVDMPPLAQVTETFSLYVYVPDVDSKALLAQGLIGEGITRQAFGTNHRVFVKSDGSSNRHLARGTCILYSHNELEHKGQDWEPDYPLSPLPAEYFAIHKVRETDTTLGKFYEDKKLEGYKNKANNCLELSDQKLIKLDDANNRDIILMDEDGQLFSGPGARKMLKGGKLDDKYKHMRVFVLGVFDENQNLEKSTSFLYENPDYKRSTFHMLVVDRDNVRMSDFVKEKTGVFEKGQVFYEFTEKEDLPYCRKVVQLAEAQFVKAKKGEAQTLNGSIEVFYTILPGAPGLHISPPVSKHGTKTLVHDPTQGYRCLKKGMCLLYKCKDPKNGNSNYNNAASSVDPKNGNSNNNSVATAI